MSVQATKLNQRHDSATPKLNLSIIVVRGGEKVKTLGTIEELITIVHVKAEHVYRRKTTDLAAAEASGQMHCQRHAKTCSLLNMHFFQSI